MDPKAVIESYVDDVVLHLPARLRKDVGLELRDLLMEDLANKARAAGRTPDEAMTLALLEDFGTPGDVAARYRPAGSTIIPAREARVLSWLAIGGVAAQWALSIPNEVVAPTHGDVLSRLGAWSVGSGLHAFALPGALAMSGAAYAWWMHRKSGGDDVVVAFTRDLPPLRALDSDRINRWSWGLALIGFAIGIPFYAMIPSLIGFLPEPAQQALALDDNFVRDRAPWLLVVWAAQLALFLIVLFEGRWRVLTRRVEMALNIAGAAMLAWFLLGGPVLQNEQIDFYARLAMTGTAIMIVAVTGVKFWREQARVGEAAAPPA